MKNIGILSIILFLLCSNIVKEDYIAIEYVGSANKPMPVVYISKKTLPRSEQIVTIEYDDLPQDYIVSGDEFAFIKKTINATSNKFYEEKDYNGFKITIRVSNCSNSCYITRENSNSLFLEINRYLRKNKRNKDLISKLTVLRKSNVFINGREVSIK